MKIDSKMIYCQTTSVEELHETLRKEYEIVIDKETRKTSPHRERPSASLPVERSEEWFKGIPESSMECFSVPDQRVKRDPQKQ